MKFLFCILFFASSALAGPPRGKPVEPKPEQTASREALKGKINGKIVWSTSREGNHDIFIMNADGTGKKHLTKSKKTDWFSRFSPDGKQVLFCRSKMDWTPEPNAKNYKMWDTWIINADGTDEKLLIKNSAWATWRPDGKTIVFARGTQVYSFNLETQETKLLLDSKESLPKAAILQNPHMSPDGKYLSITLRGKMRETGIWNLAEKTWTTVGVGCQINWFPAGDRVVRMNPTGNGGSEVLSFYMENGKPKDPKLSIKEMNFMDLPGRRSHEYFPQISADGKWMVWAVTQRGHDHDIADYEVFIWDINTAQDQAVRLTFHSGNDRWPDLYLEK